MDAKKVAEQLLDEVRELPDGSASTTCRLLMKCGYDLDKLPVDLFDVDNELHEASEKAGIILDMSAHEGKIEGLLFNLEFIICKLKNRNSR